MSFLRSQSLRHALIVLAAMSALLPASLSAEGSAITGWVRDAVTSEPLTAVTISTSGHASGSTDSRGQFILPVTPGHCAIQFSRLGYRTRLIDTTVAQDDTIHLEVSLVAAAVLIDEVTVVAERSALTPIPGVGGTAISPVQIEHVVGGFGDAMRALQTLPGVTSNLETSCQYSVRGGSATENLVLLGGAQLLEPYHVKESPNTSLGVVNVDLLRKMTFVPGGFTARYGDRLSSVLDLEYREGNRERLAGQVEASLTDGTVTLEGPLSAAGSGLVSLRTTYSDYVSNYLPDGAQRAPEFFDVQGTAGINTDDNNHIGTQFLVSRDRTSGISNGDYGVSLISLGSRHLLSRETMLRTTFSYYRQYGKLSWTIPPSTFSVSTVSADDDITLEEAKVFLDGRFASWYSLNAGVDVQGHDYQLHHILQPSTVPGQTSPPTAQLSEQSYRAGTYAENIFQFTPALLINAGVRADHISLTDETTVSPRLLAAYHIPNGPTIRGAWGIYYQSATHAELLSAAGAGLPPQRSQQAVHYVLGIHHQLRSDVAFRLDLYRKNLRNLISFVRLRSGEIVHSPRNDAEGYVNGAELEFTVNDERVMAWINVALMQGREINLYDGRGWRYLPTDQKITVTAVFEYRIGSRWTTNLRAFYGSGYAYGDDLPGVDDRRLHYPNYTRADVRVNFLFSLAGLDCLSFLEIMNLFNYRNVSSFATIGEKVPVPDYNLLLPRVVNIGLKVKF